MEYLKLLSLLCRFNCKTLEKVDVKDACKLCGRFFERHVNLRLNQCQKILGGAQCLLSNG